MSRLQEWKEEPLSPLVDSENDVWFTVEEKNDDELILELNTDTNPTERAKAAQQLLDDIEDYVKKEEQFNEWFEEKIDLPIFEEIPAIPIEETNLKQNEALVATVQDLGLIKTYQLTPPQSPPNQILPEYDDSIHFEQPESIYEIHVNNFSTVDLNTLYSGSSLTYIQPQQYESVVPVQAVKQIYPFTTENIVLSAPPTPIHDLARELETVDEIVRNTAQDLGSSWDQWESDLTSSSCSESSSSPQRSDSQEEEEETDDPEWMPVNTTKQITKMASKSTKRSKPYVRTTNPEDKKVRKKEQNKNAATRYRQKKKAEVNDILCEEKILETKQAELQQEVHDITKEIKYLKGFMKDLLMAKKIIK